MKVRKVGTKTTKTFNEWIELIYNNEYKVCKTTDIKWIYQVLNNAHQYIDGSLANSDYIRENKPKDEIGLNLLEEIDTCCDIIEELNIKNLEQ